jgi:hypothetical protein
MSFTVRLTEKLPRKALNVHRSVTPRSRSRPGGASRPTPTPAGRNRPIARRIPAVNRRLEPNDVPLGHGRT